MNRVRTMVAQCKKALSMSWFESEHAPMNFSNLCACFCRAKSSSSTGRENIVRNPKRFVSKTCVILIQMIWFRLLCFLIGVKA